MWILSPRIARFAVHMTSLTEANTLQRRIIKPSSPAVLPAAAAATRCACDHVTLTWLSFVFIHVSERWHAVDHHACRLRRKS